MKINTYEISKKFVMFFCKFFKLTVDYKPFKKAVQDISNALTELLDSAK